MSAHVSMRRVGSGLLALLPALAVGRTPAISSWALRLTLATTFGIAGIVHLVIAPAHLAESSAVGGLMILAGTAQLLVVVAILHPPAAPRAVVAAAPLGLALLAAYALAVTIGLPPALERVGPPAAAPAEAAAHAHDAAGEDADHPHSAAVPHVEAVTPVGGVTLALELIGVGAAVVLAVRGRRTPAPVCLP